MSNFFTAHSTHAYRPRLDLTGPRLAGMGFAISVQVARPARINKWVQRSAAQAALLPGAKRILIYLAGQSEPQTLGKTCAKHVQTSWQNTGTTFHSQPTNPQAVKLATMLSPAFPADFTHTRTHFVHSFVDKITDVISHLSQVSTMPTTTTTT
jgi:hypothetical protein